MKDQLTKEQLIEIAKIGFPERVKQFINFDNCEMIHMSGVFRLYDKNEDFMMALPKEHYLAIDIGIGPEKFIQITCGTKAFNHYAAILTMIKMGIV